MGLFIMDMFLKWLCLSKTLKVVLTNS